MRWRERRIRSQEQSKQGTELSRQLGCSVEHPGASRAEFDASLCHRRGGGEANGWVSFQVCVIISDSSPRTAALMCFTESFASGKWFSFFLSPSLLRWKLKITEMFKGEGAHEGGNRIQPCQSSCTFFIGHFLYRSRLGFSLGHLHGTPHSLPHRQPCPKHLSKQSKYLPVSRKKSH